MRSNFVLVPPMSNGGLGAKSDERKWMRCRENIETEGGDTGRFLEPPKMIIC